MKTPEECKLSFDKCHRNNKEYLLKWILGCIHSANGKLKQFNKRIEWRIVEYHESEDNNGLGKVTK